MTCADCRADQLQSGAPAHGLGLRGQPHLAHAARADGVEQVIGAIVEAALRKRLLVHLLWSF